VRISRSGGTISFPCRFSLVAAMNPCPCGYLSDARRSCSCARRAVELYRSRLSGPLLDRFDVHLSMARPHHGDLLVVLVRLTAREERAGPASWVPPSSQYALGGGWGSGIRCVPAGLGGRPCT